MRISSGEVNDLRNHAKSRRFCIVILQIVLIIGFPAGELLSNAQDCVPRDFGYGSIVCVCNATYCDDVQIDVPDKGQYHIYESGKTGKRMSKRIGNIDNTRRDATGITLVLSLDHKFQKIHVFGGGFSDSTGINIKKLSQGAQNLIMKAYFGTNGSRYSLGRVPIGGTDFSTRPYTYDDNKDDVTLEKFALADEDFEYKILFMQAALDINPALRFIAVPWSAPLWMKTNEDQSGLGYLRAEHYQVYADYLLKFLSEYNKHGLKMWAISSGNEPIFATQLQIKWKNEGNIEDYIRFQTMGWTPESMADWIANHFGPTIAASELNDTLLLVLEDQRTYLPEWPGVLLNNSIVDSYVAGISIHWYFDDKVAPERLDITKDLFPDKFLIMTEACILGENDAQKVHLGDWSRGEKYVLSIIENLNHWATGWIDWNLALDQKGGPNWRGIFVDSSIIVNPETDEFFKQPTYYAIARFSKFVPPNSIRISITNSSEMKTIAFLTPEDDVVIVLYNPSNVTLAFTVNDREQGKISTSIPSYSVATIIYKRVTGYSNCSTFMPSIRPQWIIFWFLAKFMKNIMQS